MVRNVLAGRSPSRATGTSRRDLRLVLNKQGLTQDGVYDRAYAYVRENY